MLNVGPGLLAVIAMATTAQFFKMGSCERSPRIVRGQIATKNEFPFIVALGLKESSTLRCGGSIYNEKTIITAAHCVVDEKDAPFSILHFIIKPRPQYYTLAPSALFIVAGEHFVDRLEGPEQLLNVSKVIVHPNYSGNREAFDIALLELATPLRFNKYVKPIEIASWDYVAVGFGTIVGWGVAVNGEPSEVLRKARVPLIPQLVCSLSYGDFRILSNICAGGTTQDTCNGDSGGPLLCGEPPILCGITSYGSGCGRLLRPGAYTKVSYFNSWISKNAAKVAPAAAPQTTVKPVVNLNSTETLKSS